MHITPAHPGKLPSASPVIVGGIGGSGTRVIATILEHAGIYMGYYRNPEMDSGFFGRLIAAYPTLSSEESVELTRRLELFTRLHLGKAITPSQAIQLYAYVSRPKLQQCWLHLRRAYTPEMSKGKFTGWGFKHPCAHFYLRQFAHHYPAARYVHVIRHGLDMAFSTNHHQIINWGQTFGVDPGAGEITASMRLDFWIRVNQWVFEECNRVFPGKHLIVSFDRLCMHPAEEMQRLMQFLDVTPQVSMAQLVHLVKTPASIGRYRGKEGLFTQNQIEEVRKFGFDVDAVTL